MHERRREEARDPGESRLVGQVEDVRRASLEHRDLLGLGREVWQQRDCRCARADDHNLLVGDVQVLRPELRMDDLALELVESGDMRRQRMLVVIVPGAEDDEPRLYPDGQGLLLLLIVAVVVVHVDVQVPEILFRGPVGRGQMVAILDVPVDSGFGGGFLHILLDGPAVRDGTIARPRTPCESEGVQIRVGADAGVAKEIPGAPDGRSGFEDSVGIRGELRLDAIGSVDARDASSDDDNIVGGSIRAGDSVDAAVDRAVEGSHGEELTNYLEGGMG